MTNSCSSRRFDYLSWTKAAEAASIEGSTLIWPFGACEQHGPHLPLATDNLFAERLAIEVLERIPTSMPIWMLPSQSLGFSPEHASFSGTISLSASLLLQLVMEVGKQLGDIGLSRLLFFNAHGGQIGLLQAAARQLRLECPSMAVLPCFLWSGVSGLKNLIPVDEIERGLHAGLAETSLMIALAPELVGEERPRDGDHSSSDSKATPPPGWTLEGVAPCAWLTEELSNSGVIGDSSEANLSLGKAIQHSLTDHWAQLLMALMESNWPPTIGTR